MIGQSLRCVGIALLATVGSVLVWPAASARGGDAADGGDLDRRFLTVAEQVPAFGGAYLAPASGAPNAPRQVRVWLLEPSPENLAAALNALRVVIGEPFTTEDAIALRADFGFADLWRWKQMAGELLARSDVHLVDLDETRNRVVLGISKDADRSGVNSAVTAEGIPASAVELVETGPIVPVPGSPGGGRSKLVWFVCGVAFASGVLGACLGFILRRRRSSSRNVRT